MIVENLKMALSALFANKMRSFLTMLGIIIGIGAVIITTSLGDTVRKMFSDLFANFGVSQAYIYIQGMDIKESDWFTLDDIKQFKEKFPEKLAYIDANDTSSVDVKNKQEVRKITVNGVDSNYIDLQPEVKMVEGRFLSKSDIINEADYCVMKDVDAKKLFGTENAVGRKFRTNFNGDYRQFTIIGIYKENISSLQKALMGLSSDTGVMYVPWSLYQNEHDAIFNLRVFANSKMSSEELKEFFKEFMAYIVRYKGTDEERYVIYSVQENFQQVDGILATVSLVMGSIAGISLLVGGIGIMNIMLVSVTERTKEIGIRKALGATTKDILTQFLIESAVLSGVGGMMGTGLAILIVVILGITTSTEVVVHPMSIVLAVGFSALVGLFFGIYPANKAAKKDPIEALRFE